MDETYPDPLENRSQLPSVESLRPGHDRHFFKRHPATFGLAGLLALVYAAVSFPNGFAKPTDQILFWGNLYPTAVDNHEWWRIFTTFFLHSNPGHLASVLFGILVFGGILEPVLGRGRMVFLYIVAAGWGMLASYLTIGRSESLGLGIENGFPLGMAIMGYGLLGCYAALMFLGRKQFARSALISELKVTLPLAAAFVIWNALESLTHNSWGNAAAFVGGAVFALWLQSRQPSTG